jgi:putative transposase
VYHQKQTKDQESQLSRRGRKPLISEDNLLGEIRCILKETEALGFCGEGYRKVWAKLRFKGLRADKERVRLIMGKNNLLAPHRQRNAKGPRHHDGTIIPMAPNLMWGTDATATHTMAHGNVTVFAAVDHFTGECVGIHAAIIGDRFEALEPLRQGIATYYGRHGKEAAKGLLVRHDHGSQYMSKHFQKELKFYGIESSPSFVRSPEGNGVIERFFRTLKEQLLWVKHFYDVEELRRALHEFKDKYNNHWIMQRHNYQTPKQVRDEWLAGMMKAA